jgi:metallophosphoesterase (TIGR00282 family)
MRVLFVGDVVGEVAGAWLAERLPRLRDEQQADLVIINAENMAFDPHRADGRGNFGMTLAGVESLFAAGADVITSGNHAWDTSPAETAAVHGHPRVLRPLNMPATYPGKGAVTVELRGQQVTVVNLATPDAIADALPPAEAWAELAPQGTIIVDLHAESMIQKHVIAHGLDGSVAAVLGTHTHEPSLYTRILPGGTAFVPEVGMTGPLGGGQGIPGEVYRRLWTGEGWKVGTELAPGPLTLGAVLLEIEGGLTRAITRLNADT